METIDWAERWRRLVLDREMAAASNGGHSDPQYWDRRAASFARSTASRADPFLDVVAPFVSPRKTLIDVGAGAGRHAAPLADRLEWVTAVEPSEGMRARIPHRDNMTIVASDWADAEVATADLVISCHVLYGIEDPVPFITKMERVARERVFLMLREGDPPHVGAALRLRLQGKPAARQPGFSDLFLLLMQMGIAPEVTFTRYHVVNRYASFEEALEDCRSFIGESWDEERGPAELEGLLTRDGDAFVFDSGLALSGVAHWQPRA